MGAAVVDAAQVARRVQAETLWIMLRQPFFGSLLGSMDVVPSWDIPTAATDGSRIYYNPGFVQGLGADELRGLLAHEVLHPALGHLWRRGQRDPRLWNVAGDAEINRLLLAEGFKLPAGGVNTPGGMQVTYPDGASTEAIYNLIPRGMEEDGWGIGPDLLPPDDAGPTVDEWQARVCAAAMHARDAGKIPGFAEGMLNRIVRPNCSDLVGALLRFVQETRRPDDYTWARPNPRYTQRGFYLPATCGTETPGLLVVVDTSGSVSPDLLSRFAGAVAEVQDSVCPAWLEVWGADTRIASRARFERGDRVTVAGCNLRGGGGTDFRPAFEEVAQLPEAPAAVVYLTDLAGAFPRVAPAVPVLWVVSDPEDRRIPVPWGEVIYCAP